MKESFITAVALLVDMATLTMDTTILTHTTILFMDMDTPKTDVIIIPMERHINEFGIVTVWADAGMNITRKNICVRG